MQGLRAAKLPGRHATTRIAIGKPAKFAQSCIQNVLPLQAVAVSGAEILDDIKKLKAENEALRAELARLQGVSPQAVRFTIPTSTPRESPGLSPSGPLPPSSPLDPTNLEDGIQWPTPGEKFWNRAPRTHPLTLETPDSQPPPPRDPNSLHVVHITAEMAPIAKVGGLGDVVTGLARECLARGHNVSVMLPFYECLPQDQIEGLKHEADIDVPKGSLWDGTLMVSNMRTSVFWGKIAGCPVYLIRPANWNECNVFKGSRIYGGSYNELEAYLFFCRASLEFLKLSGQQPHVLHIHEWQACAAAMLHWEVYHGEGLWRPRVVLTIHNMDNTGECRQDEFGLSGFPGESLATVDKALDERTIGHNPERLSLLKGGLIYSNAITTVSPTYGKEILDGGAASWLRDTINRPDIREKLRGILNGIDTHEWNPAADPMIPAPFNAASPEGKALCKKYVQQGLGLEVNPNRPLMLVVSRLVPQKGVGLMQAALYRTIQQGGQFVLLGSGHSDGAFKALANGEFANHQQARLMVMYSESLSHLLYAAADMVLVPSMFEPCGLTQMIALRYGAVPVVRRTGGLADTVRDVDSCPEGVGNGYTFDGADEGSLFQAMDRAINHYQTRRSSWDELARRNMMADVSWGRSAKEYVDVYESVGAL